MNNRYKRWLSIKRDQNARGILLIEIVLFNLFLWFFSSILAYLIEPNQYGSIIAALWESGITWMLEPGFYDPSVSYLIRVISIVVIIISMITFTGGIIGYVGNLFSSIIDNAKAGKSKLYLYDHILILNWNYKGLELIADYMHDDDTNTVVILSNQPKNEVENEINRKMYHQKSMKRKLHILIREGEVFSKSDLMKVCIEEAKSIIILSDESSAHNATSMDMFSMKTLMLVSNLNLSLRQTILVEVKEQQTVLLINEYIAKNKDLTHQILPILPDELMGRLIAQTLLMPTLNKVYHELLSFDGSEFYTVANQDARTFMETHHQAIPIYSKDNLLYVLAESKSDLNKIRENPLSTYRKLTIKDQSRYQDKHILIFGKNRKLPFILDSIKLYELENKTHIDVLLIDSNDSKDIEKTTEKMTCIDHILILSEDDLDREQYDSDVLVTLLKTQSLAKKFNAEIIIELLDPRHFDIAQSYNVKNTIISNEYISRLMTQLSKNRMLYDLFIDLLTYDSEHSEEESYEVYAYQAKHVIEIELPLSFNSVAEAIYSFYMSGNQEYIFIGLMRDSKLRLFKGDFDQKEILTIEPDDYLVVICK